MSSVTMVVYEAITVNRACSDKISGQGAIANGP